MKNETEFLAEIYDRYDKNKRLRKRKYIKTAVSLCLFLMIGTALPSVLSGAQSSAESEKNHSPSNGETKEFTVTATEKNTESLTDESYADEITNANIYERFDFGSENAATPTSEPLDNCYTLSESSGFTYPFSSKEIASVTVRNGKGKTYYIASEQNVSVFYSYLIREGTSLLPSSQIADDSKALYTVEISFFIGETKCFYITDKNIAKRFCALMEGLQKHEP